MRRSMTLWVQLAFLAAFLIASVWLAFLHPAPDTTANDPKSRCEAKGDWWDDRDKLCAVPMPIETMTRRPVSH